MPLPFKVYRQDYYERQLFPSNLFDLLPENYECSLY